jgi:L-rhamnose mutarotase
MVKPKCAGAATRIKIASSQAAHERKYMKRYGMLIKVKEDAIASYKEYHAKVWPEVLATIRACNIKNYSIFLKDDFLFAYFEYHGTDYAADMKKMAADPKTQEWWKIMMPIQVPIDTRAEGEWWAQMEEVFHTE